VGNNRLFYLTSISYTYSSFNSLGDEICKYRNVDGKTEITTKIKQLESIRDFKKRLKILVLDHPFYLLNVFFIFEEVNRTNN
jgi:hypothetical protein